MHCIFVGWQAVRRNYNYYYYSSVLIKPGQHVIQHVKHKTFYTCMQWGECITMVDECVCACVCLSVHNKIFTTKFKRNDDDYNHKTNIHVQLNYKGMWFKVDSFTLSQSVANFSLYKDQYGVMIHNRLKNFNGILYFVKLFPLSLQ